MINMIWAQREDGVIGVNNAIPWHVPEDFKHFKEKTSQSTVVMGRKTWESLPVKPLPNRRNIVLTRDLDFVLDSAEVINDYQEVFFEKDVWIMGGEKIYSLFMKHADNLVVTYIEQEVGSVDSENIGDSVSYAPMIDKDAFEIHSTSGKKTSSNGISYSIVEYRRK